MGAQGAFAHQQIDHLALFRPITKRSARLEAGRAFQTIDDAFRAVLTLPPGPVHVVCPGDMTAGEDSDDFHVTAEDTMISPPRTFDAAVSHARKPLLLIGLGARRLEDAIAVRRLCEEKRIPAMVTYKGKGVVPDEHPCFAGVFTNGALEKELIDESDCLIGIGLDPVELLPRPWTFKPPIVGVNGWRVSTSHVPFGAQWIIDVPTAAAFLADRAPLSEWELRRFETTVRAQRQAIDIPAGGMTSPRVVDAAAGMLAETCRVTVDAGAHMFPATLRWPVGKPNGMLISNGLSTMGFALPAAIGAALLERESPDLKTRPPSSVVALTGDAGLLMCAGELVTAVRERLRVITIVFSDAALSLIEIKQQARKLKPAGVALGAVRWQALGESLGLASFAASTEDELRHAIEQAMTVQGPSLIEASVDRSNYGAMLKVIRG
jgi:acetolactate synthase-1/2/3 large subunit